MKAIFSRPQYILFICVLVAYFAFLTQTYYWDGVLFALNIESVHQGRIPFFALFHPNHLLYNAFGYEIYLAALWVWPGIRAITALQIFNVLASACCGYILFRIARRITLSTAIALFCWLLFAAGATWWKFSTDADTYIIAVLFLLLAALLFLDGRVWVSAACHAAAMLFHELAVFTYVPVLAAFLLDRREPVQKRLAAGITYCAVTGAVVGTAYILCYLDTTRAPNPNGFLSWITSYASDSSFTRSLSDIGHYLTSYVKLFAGGKITLVAQFFGVVECLAFAACIGFIVRSVALVRRPASPDTTKIDAQGLTFLWAWFIGYAVFLGIWDPGSAFHKLFVWPAIVLLIGIYTRNRVPAATVLAGALAAWNFGAFIFPHSHAAADPVLSLAHKVNRELPKDATVYYSVLDPDDWYLQYFAPGRSWRPLSGRSDLEGACLETTALEALKKRSLPMDPKRKWDLVNSAHNIRLECLTNTR